MRRDSVIHTLVEVSGTTVKDSLNQEEFVRMWAAESRRVYAYILTLLPNSADADEIFQETSITAWQKFDSFQPGSNFFAWSKKIAWNKIGSFRQLRRHSTCNFNDEFIRVVDEELAAHEDLLDAQQKALADCYAKLRQSDQELLGLRYSSDFSVSRIALKLGRSVDVIYKSLRRIHSVLLDCVISATSVN